MEKTTNVTGGTRRAWRVPLLALLAAAPLHAGQARPEPVMVYCMSASEDGFVDPDVADSTRDLKNALAGKKKTLRLVEDARAADLLVVVEDRAREVVGVPGTAPWGGPVETRPRTVKRIYATLDSAGHRTALEASDDLFWSVAADDLAGQIERWIKTNRERLVAARR